MSVKVNLKIFLFIAIFYITKQIEIYAILMFFAVLHELGHLLCGLFLGLKPKSFKIMPLGFSVEFQTFPEDYNQKVNQANRLAIKKMWIALAGPIMNLLLIGMTFLLQNNLTLNLYEEIIYSNLLIAVFNLFPIYPLDGGRVLHSLVHVRKGKKVAMEWTNQISNISMIVLTAIASIAIYYYKNIAILFIIAYLWGLMIVENKRYQMKKRIYKIIENS